MGLCHSTSRRISFQFPVSVISLVILLPQRLLWCNLLIRTLILIPYNLAIRRQNSPIYIGNYVFYTFLIFKAPKLCNDFTVLGAREAQLYLPTTTLKQNLTIFLRRSEMYDSVILYISKYIYLFMQHYSSHVRNLC